MIFAPSGPARALTLLSAMAVAAASNTCMEYGEWDACTSQGNGCKWCMSYWFGDQSFGTPKCTNSIWTIGSCHGGWESTPAPCDSHSSCAGDTYCDSNHNCYDCDYVRDHSCDALDGDCSTCTGAHRGAACSGSVCQESRFTFSASFNGVSYCCESGVGSITGSSVECLSPQRCTSSSPPDQPRTVTCARGQLEQLRELQRLVRRRHAEPHLHHSPRSRGRSLFAKRPSQ